MNCYLCDNEMAFIPSWRRLFFNDFEEVACVKCKSGFEKITGSCCKFCSRRGEAVCEECSYWETTPYGGLIRSGQCLFDYTLPMREYFHQYKFMQDVVLAEVFAGEISSALRKTKAVIVPIPMNQDKLIERTFSQVNCLLDAAGLSYQQFLIKNGEVQGKKSKAERMAAVDMFQWNGETVPKKIVLVDDLYTTGTTLRQAAKEMSRAGAEEITIFSLIRG